MRFEVNASGPGGRLSLDETLREVAPLLGHRVLVALATRQGHPVGSVIGTLGLEEIAVSDGVVETVDGVVEGGTGFALRLRHGAGGDLVGTVLLDASSFIGAQVFASERVGRGLALQLGDVLVQIVYQEGVGHDGA